MVKKRIYELDILRGIAFLAVVLQHSLAGFIYEPQLKMYEGITSALMLNAIRFAVPLFVVLTGFSLYYSDKGEGYLTFIKKRFKQIILPYLLWTVIYDIFMFFINGMKTQSIDGVLLEYLKYVFTGTASYHLWYMVMIIQFYLVSPFFKVFLNKNYSKLRNNLALIGFFIVHLLLIYWYNFKAGSLYEASSGALREVLVYRDRVFIMWMFYFVLGAYFSIYIDEVKKILSKAKYIFLVLFIGSLSYVMFKMINSASFNEQGGYTINHFIGSPLNYIMFPLLLTSIIVLYPLSEFILKKNGRLKESLINIGKYSFGAYLAHALILHYINAGLSVLVPWFFPKIIVSFVLTAFISIYLVKFLSKSNNTFVLKLVGLSKKK